MSDTDLSEIHLRLTRQLDIIPMEVLDTPVTVIGAGAIGSFVTLALAKMGFYDFMVYDDDKIEPENMNCQFFRVGDVGKNKARALGQLVKSFTEEDIAEFPYKWEPKHAPNQGVVITAVDNMDVRRQVFEAHKGQAPNTKWVIDPRMSAEVCSVQFYNPADPLSCERYQKTLYSDNESVEERCTAKSTVYTVLSISGLVAVTVKNLLTGNPSEFVEWHIPTMDVLLSQAK